MTVKLTGMSTVAPSALVTWMVKLPEGVDGVGRADVVAQGQGALAGQALVGRAVAEGRGDVEVGRCADDAGLQVAQREMRSGS